MSFDSLHLDIWRHIISFLAPSLPKSLSGWTKGESIGESAARIAERPDDGSVGTVNRSHIRAGALASLMRTSICMNHLASPILYSTVMTDNLVGLIVGLYDSAISPHTESKSRLLGHTRRLHLEYSKKGDGPTYHQIMSSGGSWSAVEYRNNLDQAMSQSGEEEHQIRESFMLLSASQNQGASFPKLEHLSVGAIFGGQQALRDRAASRYLTEDEEELIRDRDVPFTWSLSSKLMQSIFRESPITHYCQRGTHGPLSLPTEITWNATRQGISLAGDTPLFTVHFDAAQRRLPAAIGYRTQWILEQYDHYQVMEDIVDVSLKIIDRAEQTHGKRHDKCNKPKISIYASGRKRLSALSVQYSVEDQKTLTENEMDIIKLRRQVKSTTADPDKYRWVPASESPPCQACGWALEEDVA